MKSLRLLVFLILPMYTSAAELADDSVYHVGSSWTNQGGQQINISQLQDHIQVVAFVYTYCEHTCPTIIARLKQIEKSIPAEILPRVHITLVSLDPERDTPQVLKAYMQKHHLDEQRWTMLNGDPYDVLELSALFGVRYKPMGESDIAHSNMITVLDDQGIIRYQMKGMGEDIGRVVKEIDAVAN